MVRAKLKAIKETRKPKTEKPKGAAYKRAQRGVGMRTTASVRRIQQG